MYLFFPSLKVFQKGGALSLAPARFEAAEIRQRECEIPAQLRSLPSVFIKFLHFLNVTDRLTASALINEHVGRAPL